METKYITSLSGILKLLQIIFSIICFGLIVPVPRTLRTYYDQNSQRMELFDSYWYLSFLVVVACLMFGITLIIFLAYLLSFTTSDNRTCVKLEAIFCAFATIAFFLAGVCQLILLNREYDKIAIFTVRKFEEYTTAGVFALANAILYAVDAFVLMNSES